MGNSVTQESNSPAHFIPSLETKNPSSGATLEQSARIVARSSLQNEYAINLDRLKKMKVFILDYTIRRSSVGYSRGHSILEKKRIWNSIKDVGIDNYVLAELRDSFSVEDEIAAYIALTSSQSRKQSYYCVSKLYCEVEHGIPSFITPPSVTKMSKYGFSHIILDFSVCDPFIDWRKFFFQDFLDLMTLRLEQIRAISPNGRILLCCRDAVDSYLSVQNQNIILSFIAHVSLHFASRYGIFALMVEDATGTLLPWEVANIIRIFRGEMDSNGWSNGHLLINAGKGYGMAEMIILSALSEGATGIWCGICEEGGIAGHVSSTSIITNLYRLGNQFISSQFQVEKLCDAAARVSKIITALPVSLRQEVYGPRCSALFNKTMLSLGSNNVVEKNINFQIDEFAVVDENDFIDDPLLSMIPEDSELLEQLELTFGRRNYNMKVVSNMRHLLLRDTKHKRKCDYYSSIGLFFLYERGGGADYLEDMAQLVILDESFREFDKHPLLLQLRDYFSTFTDCGGNDVGDILISSNYSSNDDADFNGAEIYATNPMVGTKSGTRDLHISYYAFFDGFVANFLAHAATKEFKELMELLDYDKSNSIAWDQICLRARWALAEYPLERDTWKLEDFIHIIVTAFLLPELGRKSQLHLFAQKLSLFKDQTCNVLAQKLPDESLEIDVSYGIDSDEAVSVLDLNEIERGSYDLNNLPPASKSRVSSDGNDMNSEFSDNSVNNHMTIFSAEDSKRDPSSYFTSRIRVDSLDCDRVATESAASLKKKMNAFNLSSRSGENILLRRRSSVRAMQGAVPVESITIKN